MAREMNTKPTRTRLAWSCSSAIALLVAALYGANLATSAVAARALAEQNGPWCPLPTPFLGEGKVWDPATAMICGYNATGACEDSRGVPVGKQTLAECCAVVASSLVNSLKVQLGCGVMLNENCDTVDPSLLKCGCSEDCFFSTCQAGPGVPVGRGEICGVYGSVTCQTVIGEAGIMYCDGAGSPKSAVRVSAGHVEAAGPVEKNLANSGKPCDPDCCNATVSCRDTTDPVCCSGYCTPAASWGPVLIEKCENALICGDCSWNPIDPSNGSTTGGTPSNGSTTGGTPSNDSTTGGTPSNLQKSSYPQKEVLSTWAAFATAIACAVWSSFTL